MYEELVIGIVLIDLAATLAGTTAIWKKVSNLDHRLTILETKYCIQVNGVQND
jgi:hypothetical protein